MLLEYQVEPWSFIGPGGGVTGSWRSGLTWSFRGLAQRHFAYIRARKATGTVAYAETA